MKTFEEIKQIVTKRDFGVKHLTSHGIETIFNEFLRRCQNDGDDHFVFFYMIEAETGLQILSQYFDKEGNPIPDDIVEEIRKQEIAHIESVKQNKSKN